MSISRIVLADEGLDFERLLEIIPEVGPSVYAIKVHASLYRHGLDVVRRLHEAGAPRVWVDAKLHDIPNTVELSAKAIAESGADILTIHASGEVEVMEAAVRAGPTEVYAVTVLTSLVEEQAHLLYGQPSGAAALYLARLAKLAGVHGVVCSPQEVGLLARRPELSGMKLITPGVRSSGSSTDDQKRTSTPAQAIASGATHCVIGRQVTQAKEPVEALRKIIGEISAFAFREE